MKKCVAGSEHGILDRNRVCKSCGEYVPVQSMLMRATATGSIASYGEPDDPTTPYILTTCTKCKLDQKLFMAGFGEDDLRLMSILIGWNPTNCCGAPMMTRVVIMKPKEES
jgi:hypothetical protein